MFLNDNTILIIVDSHLGLLFHAVFLPGVTIPGELAAFLEEWGLVSGGAEHAGTCGHGHHHLAMVVVEDGDWLMAGIGEDLQEGINRGQVKAGKGEGSSFFLGGNRRDIEGRRRNRGRQLEIRLSFLERIVFKRQVLQVYFV